MLSCGGGRSSSDRSKWLSVANAGVLGPPRPVRMRRRRGRYSQRARLILEACLEGSDGSGSKVVGCPLTIQEAGGFAETSRRRNAGSGPPRIASPPSATRVRLRPTAWGRTHRANAGRPAMAEAPDLPEPTRPMAELQPRDYQAALFEEAKAGNVSASVSYVPSQTSMHYMMLPCRPCCEPRSPTPPHQPPVCQQPLRVLQCRPYPHF